jgi:uncharacterized protein (DUF169 family)
MAGKEVSYKMEEILDKFSKAVEKYVRPQTYPIAIKMLTSEEEVPEKALRPTKDFKHRVAICQGFALARRWGLSMAILKDDNYCPFAAINLGFYKPPKFYFDGNVALGYYAKNLEAGAKLEKAVFRFKTGQYAGLAIAPLSTANFEPDVIAIYGNSMQMMRLVNAYLWNKGGRLENSVTARAACTEVIPKTILTKECGVVIPCYGEREWGMTSDDELIFTAPTSKLSDITEGLEGSYKYGARIIARSNLSWEAGMFEPYDKLSEMLGIPYKKEVLEWARTLEIPRTRKSDPKR